MPATHWIEKDGSFVNSGRWAQWKYKVLAPPRARRGTTTGSSADLFLRVKALYAASRAARSPTRSCNLTWDYTNPRKPTLDEMAQEINGSTSPPASGWPASPACKDDGTTTAGDWIYTGVLSAARAT